MGPFFRQMHIRRHPAAFAATLLAVGAVGTGVAIAATNPGDPDPDFNGGQARLVDFPETSYEDATQVAVAPDGSIYVAGCDCDDDTSYYATSLSHLTAAGEPITSFGTLGTGALTDYNHESYAGPTALGFAANGDLLVGESTRQELLARNHANDGSIDGDFTVLRYTPDTGAFVDQAREDFDPESSDYQRSAVRGFAPTGDGHVLALGSTGHEGNGNNSFAGVELDGRDNVVNDWVDSNSHADAIVAGHQPGGPDGSYVIAGTGIDPADVNVDLRSASVRETNVPAWVLHRYSADGTPDDSYGGTFDEDTFDLYARDGAIAGDGAVYMIADINDADQTLRRFTADGKPDPGFAPVDASVFGGELSQYDLAAVAGTPDGKAILVAQHRTVLGSETVVARINKDGTLDTAFGDNGVRVLPMVANATDMQPADAVVQSDGKAVVAGTAWRNDRQVELARAKGTGSALASNEQQAFVTRLGTSEPKPPVTTTDTTPATTTTTTTTQTTTTTTTTTAKPVTAQSVPKACSSKRSFKIRLRIPRGDTPTSAIVKVNGKQVKVVKGSRLRSQIDLRGLPKGTVKVSITVKLAGGKKPLKGQRTYHTCIPKQGDSIPVL